MNWYLQNGKESDVVINTKVNYSRNLRNFKFGTKNTIEVEKIENEVKSKLPSLGYNLKFIKMKDIDNITKQELVEKDLISKKVSLDKKQINSIFINDEENICIMLNEEDHIKLQVYSPGMDIANNFNLAKEIDLKMEKVLDIAKSEKYGYLTTVPTKVGTGLKMKITLFLPGLTKTGNIRQFLQVVSSFGLDLYGLNIVNSKNIGDMYELTNKQTLGISEENIVKNIKAITEKIIEQERMARKMLGQNQVELEDMIYRSYGILTNCRKIKKNEALELMSDVKLGTDLGLLKQIDDKKVMQIYLYINSANLQKYFGQRLDTYDREIKRAEMIKQIIDKK